MQEFEAPTVPFATIIPGVGETKLLAIETDENNKNGTSVSTCLLHNLIV